MAARSVLITGCNRGLGLEFVRQFLALPEPPAVLFATCRDPEKATDLKALADGASSTKVIVTKLDVADENGVASLVQRVSAEVQGSGLNLLIHNSGMFDKSAYKLEQQTEACLTQHFLVNSTAPILLTKAFIPLLKTAAEKYPNAPLHAHRSGVVMIGTKMASMADNTTGGGYPYRMSKAALHMGARSLAHDLKPLGIQVLLLHPGWVRTDMGGPNGLIDVPESISGMLNVIKAADESKSGVCYDYAGKLVPF